MSIFRFRLLVFINICKILCITFAHDVSESVHINWFAPFLSGGGYCSEASAFMFSAEKSNLKFSAIHHGDSVNQHHIDSLTSIESDSLRRHTSLSSSKDNELIVNICHSEPGAWYVPRPKYYTTECPPTRTVRGVCSVNIGRTMFETDRLPSGWIDRLQYMDEIWVPTEFSKTIFMEAGIPADKLRVVAEPVDTDFYRPISDTHEHFLSLQHTGSIHEVNAAKIEKLISLQQNGTKLLLFVGKFEGRKGIDVLLKAYFEEFIVTRHDKELHSNVLLVIVTSSYHSSNDFEAEINKLLAQHNLVDTTTNSSDSVRYMILSGVHQRYMPLLYNLATALVIPSHGEGWGRPHMEAMSCGVPVIATNWSGPTAFITDSNGYLIEIEDELDDTPGWNEHKWAQPEVSHLAALFRHVVSDANTLEVRAKGLQARQDMVEKFSLAVMGEVLRHELDRLSGAYLNIQDSDSNREL